MLLGTDRSKLGLRVVRLDIMRLKVELSVVKLKLAVMRLNVSDSEVVGWVRYSKVKIRVMCSEVRVRCSEDDVRGTKAEFGFWSSRICLTNLFCIVPFFVHYILSSLNPYQSSLTTSCCQCGHLKIN